MLRFYLRISNRNLPHWKLPRKKANKDLETYSQANTYYLTKINLREMIWNLELSLNISLWYVYHKTYVTSILCVYNSSQVFPFFTHRILISTRRKGYKWLRLLCKLALLVVFCDNCDNKIIPRVFGWLHLCVRTELAHLFLSDKKWFPWNNILALKNE